MLGKYYRCIEALAPTRIYIIARKYAHLWTEDFIVSQLFLRSVNITIIIIMSRW